MADPIDIRTRQALDHAQEIAKAHIGAAVAGGGGPPHNIDMEQRLAKLEGSYDALKVVRPMTVAVVSVFLAALVFVLGFLGIQVARVDSKVDGISKTIFEEFRAMRSDMAAQTSAIANSITATKQQSPQVILMPSPQPEPTKQN